jgi:hypothetical protein
VGEDFLLINEEIGQLRQWRITDRGLAQARELLVCGAE